MAGRPPITTETRDRIIELIRKGETRNAIARECKVSGATVSKVAADIGHEFPGAEHMKAATTQRRIENQAKRSEAIGLLYDQSLALLRKRTQTPFKKLVRGAMGAEHVEELDFIPSEDERNLGSTITGYLIAASKLEAVDVSNDMEDVKNMLGDLASSIATLNLDDA